MKSKLYYDNLQLFNLVETHEISSKTLIRVFRGYSEREIDRLAIISSIGNTPTSRSIITALEELDRTFLSLHSLIVIGINSLIINKLKTRFKSVEDLYFNQDKLIASKIHNSIRLKIIEFVEDFHLNYENISRAALEYLIISELQCHVDVISANELFLLLLDKGKEISITDFYDTVNELAKNEKVKITPKGVILSRVTINEFIESNKSDKRFQILNDRLNGMSSSNILKKYQLSRQRVAQIYSTLIDKFPVFEDESKYKNILSEYQLSQYAMDKLGLNNIQLANYIDLKYKFHPEKNEIDYVLETKRQHTEGGALVLRKNNKLWLNGFVLTYDFRNLIEHFIEIESVSQFELKSFTENLNSYFRLRNVEFNFGNNNHRAYLTRLGNIPNILSCGNNIYFYLRSENLTSEFLYLSREYIDNFYGYGSVLYFFNKNEELCLLNKISNENVLFAVLKHMYSEEYSNQIQFIRNPTIITKGISRDEFFKELIEEKSPIDRDLFFDYLNENYGLSKATLYWNSVAWFDDYLDEQNQLNIKDKEDLSFFQNFIDEIFGKYVIISTDYYKKQLSSLRNDESKRLFSNNLLRKLGYRYSNKGVYRRYVNNINDAYRELFSQLEKTISYHDLLKFFQLNSILYPRYEDVFEECYLLRYTEDSYINVNKMGYSNDRVMEFREKLVDSLIESRIYLSANLINTRLVLKLFEQYSDVKSMVYSMGDRLFDSILDSSRRVYSTITSRGLIFTIDERISNKLILKNLIEEFEEIDRTELEYYLSDHYGLDIELSPGYINELGYYYSQHMNTIYISKSRFDSILIDYLDNGGDNGN